jgi:hypothetical protein
MQLEGNISQFPLSELIMLITASAVTGALEVGETNCVGLIFCRDGRVYHATAGKRVGVDAVRRMTEAHDAPFRFIFGAHDANETLWPDPQMLIGFTRRQEQLQRLVRPYFPSLEWVPILWASADEAVHISAAIWPVLAAVDGERSVADISALLGYEPLEIGVTLSELAARGLVNIRPPHKVARPTPNLSTAEDHLERPIVSVEATLSGRRGTLAPISPTGGFCEWMLTGRATAKPKGWFVRPLSLFSHF